MKFEVQTPIKILKGKILNAALSIALSHLFSLALELCAHILERWSCYCGS